MNIDPVKKSRPHPAFLFLVAGVGPVKQHITTFLAGIILALSFAASVSADSFEDALAAYSRGDYATALRLLRPLATQGNARAKYDLGVMYDEGQGVPQDYAEAMKWYRLAADQGEAAAQNNIAAMYDMGRGVPQDYAEAAKWYRRAADQGNAKAQTSLGAMYASGEGVPQDYAEAAKWYRFAADQGNAAAQYNLGGLYANSEGVPGNLVLAHMWANLAAANGIQEAVKYRDVLAKHMTAVQIAEAQKLAREWKPTTQPMK